MVQEEDSNCQHVSFHSSFCICTEHMMTCDMQQYSMVATPLSANKEWKQSLVTLMFGIVLWYLY